MELEHIETFYFFCRMSFGTVENEPSKLYYSLVSSGDFIDFDEE